VRPFAGRERRLEVALLGREVPEVSEQLDPQLDGASSLVAARGRLTKRRPSDTRQARPHDPPPHLVANRWALARRLPHHPVMHWRATMVRTRARVPLSKEGTLSRDTIDSARITPHTNEPASRAAMSGRRSAPTVDPGSAAR
jgi:hypothetical protein